MAHIGTTDIDLSLDAESLGDGEYAVLAEALLRNGYEQRGTHSRWPHSRPMAARCLWFGRSLVAVLFGFLIVQEGRARRGGMDAIRGRSDQPAAPSINHRNHPLHPLLLRVPI